ncbi:hypothetical protein ACFQ1S_43660, partial [Kibdelosporangium lantanae]
MNTERAVLVGVHTPTSLLRLEDITLLLEDDPRIQLIYTQVPDQLGNGVAQQLQQLEVRTIPWQEARRQTFDLTISASLHQMGDVAAAHRFTAPHGAGYNKLWPDWATEPGGERQVYGLDRRSLLDDDNGVMGSGKWYGVPNYAEYVSVYYNKDQFAKYGVQ